MIEYLIFTLGKGRTGQRAALKRFLPGEVLQNTTMRLPNQGGDT